MLYVILLSSLAIISKSMITSHQRCHDVLLSDSSRQCCNEVAYFIADQTCCNGIVVNGLYCAGQGPMQPITLPNGPRLIWRADAKPVDGTLSDDMGSDADADGDTGTDGDDEEEDTDEDTGDDGTASVDEPETTSASSDSSDSSSDSSDSSESNADDDFVDGGSTSDDDSSASADSTSDSGDSINALYDEMGALYDEHGNLVSHGTNDDINDDGINALYDEHGNLVSHGYSSNNAEATDMDYYVKITLINMWLILGLIVIVNGIFYWCYCRKQKQRNKMDRVKSTNMFVDDPRMDVTDEENNEEII